MENTLHLKPINTFKFPECTDEDLTEYLAQDTEGHLHIVYLSFYNGEWSIYDTDTGESEFNLDDLVGFVPVKEINIVID